LKKDDQQHISCNFTIGCKQGGFGPGCKNCCAIEVIVKLSGKKSPVAEIAKQVIHKVDGKWQWNGVIKENPYAYRFLRNQNKDICIIATYCGECALASENALREFFWMVYANPKSKFVLLTKLPALLYDKVKKLKPDLFKYGIKVDKLKNLRIATSVENNEKKFRINQLAKFKCLGFTRLDVWFKPLLENIVNVDLTGIKSIRINVEKGKYKRCHEVFWIDLLSKQAVKQGVKVYYDFEKHELNKPTRRNK